MFSFLPKNQFRLCHIVGNHISYTKVVMTVDQYPILLCRNALISLGQRCMFKTETYKHILEGIPGFHLKDIPEVIPNYYWMGSPQLRSKLNSLSDSLEGILGGSVLTIKDCSVV